MARPYTCVICGWTHELKIHPSKCPKCKQPNQRIERVKLRLARLERIIEYIKPFKHLEDKGLGDTLERLIPKLENKYFYTVLKETGLWCDCPGNVEYWNQRYPY